ncbi:MAG: hypothetical protein FD134_2866 [Gallionellaceae bacterium]|nr:MAG: hypothetical protein FD134_2866 [Gallionellaceae bacterium]
MDMSDLGLNSGFKKAASKLCGPGLHLARVTAEDDKGQS